MPGAAATVLKSQDVRRAAFAVLGLAFCISLAGCSTKTAKVGPGAGLAPASALAEAEGGEAGADTTGKETAAPVKIAGSSSAIQSYENYSAEGLSSWYGRAFHGRRTANGEIFDMTSLTAAHPSMPLPSYARVTNINNGKSVVVRVNDRGPFHGDRALDVSQRTAELLGFKNHGMARVRIDYVGPASLKGSDNSRLMATYRENGHEPAQVMVAALDRGADTPHSDVAGLKVRGPMLASIQPAAAPEAPRTALAPEQAVQETADAKPAAPQPVQTAASTTPVDVASRIQSSFGSMTTPPPINARPRPQMVQPVLSGFVFDPSTFTAPR